MITLAFYAKGSYGQAGSPVAQKKDTVVKYDDTRKVTWGEAFKKVNILSSADSQEQKAYFYRTTSTRKMPLIVSLHTWSGNYAQVDAIAGLAEARNFNYIHPDFRGANNKPQACCSELALQDIDDAITYAIKNGNVDVSRIYIIGVSGGGYATLSSFMKLKRRVAKYSSWVPVSDLGKWYYEVQSINKRYARDVEKCTSSPAGRLNEQEARNRSPFYWKTPVSKVKKTQLEIFAGVNDGIQGSVPITQSIDFYNKLLKDLKVKDSSCYVTGSEIEQLLKYRKPLVKNLKIGDRAVCLVKQYKNIKLTIFMGNHEMLPEYAFANLTE